MNILVDKINIINFEIIRYNYNIDFIANFAYKGTSFQIYDGSGKLYQQSTINNAKTAINFAPANAGNYFLVIENSEGKRFWSKIVKR